MRSRSLILTGLMLCGVAALEPRAPAQGTAFTYQGALNAGGTPVQGSYDFSFSLYDAITGGIQQGPSNTNLAVSLDHGLFTVALDFGASFDGTARWLEVAVRTNGSGLFSTLSPRQPLTPTPYAILAGAAQSASLASQVVDASVGASQLGTLGAPVAGQVLSFDGTNLVWANPSAMLPGGQAVTSLNGLTDTVTLAAGTNLALATNGNQLTIHAIGDSNAAWLLAGNSGTVPGANFIGTTDNRPFEARVNGSRGTVWQPAYDTNGNSVTVNIIGGGSANAVSNGVVGAFIGGGGNDANGNRAGGNYSTVAGGIGNLVGGNYSFAAGFFCAANGSAATALGLESMATGASSVALGESALATGDHSVALGYNLWSSGRSATSFGQSTRASGLCSIAAGFGTKASGDYSTTMGYQTWAQGWACTALGYTNMANGFASTSLGELNLANGTAATAIGSGNVAGGDYTFAAGRNCYIQHPGCFMWSDGTLSFTTPRANSFNALATGGFFLYTGSGVGVQVAPGGNAWSVISDRNQKENFQPVDCRAVLEKVASLPVTTWNLKTQPAAMRHIGPMAQDFQTSFQVGEDDRHISTSDADGVAFAAIKGLNEKLEAENSDLRSRLARLEALVNQLSQAQKQ